MNLMFLFRLERLSIFMLGLSLILGSVIFVFAKQHLEGDRQKNRFLRSLVQLYCCLGALLTTDHLWLFFISWTICHACWIRLMVHKPQWSAARFAGILARKHFLLSALCLGLACLLLQHGHGTASIHQICSLSEFQQPSQPTFHLVLLLLNLAALIPLAIWPFHTWLLSALNAPTPALAFMPAGLLNGGGFLLLKFATLFQSNALACSVLFGLGLWSTCLGTAWQLIQTDYKRMLAASSIAHMGFSMMLCGLGLFSAAAGHLAWHAFFKAYLFLNAGEAHQEAIFASSPDLKTGFKEKLKQGIFMGLAGAWGGFLFNQSSGQSHPFLALMAFMAAAQSAYNRQGLLSTLFASGLGALAQGGGLRFVRHCLEPLDAISDHAGLAFGPGPLLGSMLLFFIWLSVLFYQGRPLVWPTLYAKLWRSAQPHRTTITTKHSDYVY